MGKIVDKSLREHNQNSGLHFASVSLLGGGEAETKFSGTRGRSGWPYSYLLLSLYTSHIQEVAVLRYPIRSLLMLYYPHIKDISHEPTMRRALKTMDTEDVLKNEIAQAFSGVTEELAGQQRMVQTLKNIRTALEDQGFASPFLDTEICNREQDAHRTEHYIEHGVLGWLCGVRKDCIASGLPATEVDFLIDEWKSRVAEFRNID